MRRTMLPTPSRHLVAMPDVELVAIEDFDVVSSRDERPRWGSPPTFTDYRKMLGQRRCPDSRRDRRHRQMAGIAHDLLDQGYLFLMEKPMDERAEVEAVAAKVAE